MAKKTISKKPKKASGVKYVTKTRTRYMPTPSLRPDNQFFDASLTLSTAAANWTFNANICVPQVGTGSSSRFGDRILLKSLQYFIYVSSAAVPCRIIIFYDKQPNNAAPVSPGPMQTVDTEAFKNPDLRERFTILRDFWIMNTSTNGVASNEVNQANGQRGYIRLNKITSFSQSTGFVSDIVTGSLVIGVYNGATNTSSIYTNFRTLFES